jgi:O-antigen ligase
MTSKWTEQSKQIGSALVIIVGYTAVVSLPPLAPLLMPALLGNALALVFWALVVVAYCIWTDSQKSGLVHQSSRLRANANLVFIGAFASLLIGAVCVWLGMQLFQIRNIFWVRPLTVQASQVIASLAAFQALLGCLQYLNWHLYIPGVAWLDIGGRVYGNIRQFNIYALWMIVGLLACAHLWGKNLTQSGVHANKSQRVNQSLWRDGVLAIAALMICCALVASASRFGMLTACSFAILGLLDWRTNRRRSLFLIAIPISYGFFFQALTLLDSANIFPFFGTQRYLSLHGAVSEAANQDRLQIWRTSIDLIQQYPWFGIGSFRLSYFSGLTMATPNFMLFTDHSHNLLLQWSLEFGVPAAALLTFLLIAIFVISLRPLLDCSEGRLLYAGLAILVAHSIIEFPWRWLFNFLPWCFALGIAVVYSKELSEAKGAKIKVVNLIDGGSQQSEQTIKSNSAHKILICSALLTIGAAVWVSNDAMKSLVLYDPRDTRPIHVRQLESQSSIAFAHLADLALIQALDPSPKVARKLHLLAADVAKVRSDAYSLTAYALAAAMDGQMCTAKAIVWQFIKADKKSQAVFFQRIEALSVNPEYTPLMQLLAYAKNPYQVSWPQMSNAC